VNINSHDSEQPSQQYLPLL